MKLFVRMCVWITKFLLHVLKIMFGVLLAMAMLVGLLMLAAVISSVSPWLGALVIILEVGFMMMWIRGDRGN